MSGGGGGSSFEEEEHEEHVNHEAWVIPYADMLTLLMALFLMLWAMSTLDLTKFEALADSLGSSLGGTSDLVQPLDGVAGGSPLTLDETRDSTIEGIDPIGDVTVDVDPQVGPALPIRAQRAEAALQREEHDALEHAIEQASMDDVRAAITAFADEAGLSAAVGVHDDPRGLVVTIVSDRVLFEPGRATIQPAGRKVLEVVAAALRPLPNAIAVEGHTDDRPIRTREFPSNWELSTARATTVLRELVDADGLPADRLSASGYAELRPIHDNVDAQGRARNRRVELVVQARAGIPD